MTPEAIAHETALLHRRAAHLGLIPPPVPPVPDEADFIAAHNQLTHGASDEGHQDANRARWKREEYERMKTYNAQYGLMPPNPANYGLSAS